MARGERSVWTQRDDVGPCCGRDSLPRRPFPNHNQTPRRCRQTRCRTSSSQCSVAASSGACSGWRESRSGCSSGSSIRARAPRPARWATWWWAPLGDEAGAHRGGARRRRRDLRVGRRARGCGAFLARTASRAAGRPVARGGAGPAHREGDVPPARHRHARVRAGRRPRRARRRDRGHRRPPGGAQDPPRRLRRQGPARAARPDDVDEAWAELGGVPLILESLVAVRPRALGARGARRSTARWRAGRWSRTTTRAGSCG